MRRGDRRLTPPIPKIGTIVVPVPGPARDQRTVALDPCADAGLPMLAGTVATALLFAGRQGGAYSYVVGGVFGHCRRSGWSRRRCSPAPVDEIRVDVVAARLAYDEALDAARSVARANVAAQRLAMQYRHPAPTVLVTLVDTVRLWERRPGDADFSAARIELRSAGSGDTPLYTRRRRRFHRTYLDLVGLGRDASS